MGSYWYYLRPMPKASYSLSWTRDINLFVLILGQIDPKGDNSGTFLEKFWLDKLRFTDTDIKKSKICLNLGSISPILDPNPSTKYANSRRSVTYIYDVMVETSRLLCGNCQLMNQSLTSNRQVSGH